jgi:hypothetical protein
MTNRSDLYDAFVLFIKGIANHPGLVQIIFEPQPNRTASPGLRALSDGSANIKQNFDILKEQSPSLFTCFNNTYRQTKLFLELSTNAKPRKSKNYLASSGICKRVVELYGNLEAKKMQHNTSYTSPLEKVKDPWAAFSEKNQLKFSDDVLLKHRFLADLPTLKTPSGARMLTIGREISTMATSLPAGIFVQVAESRSDVMKVLIVGVEGTPYAGGLFP